MKTLSDVFEHTLKDMYYAETSLTKALPKVIAEVSDTELKSALQSHLAETKNQIKVLQRVFELIGVKAEGEKCDAMQGLIEECDGTLAATESAQAKHAAIIGCCQAIEHYEIARYGTLREWAKVLGQMEAHELLTGILDQEKAADHKLTHIAVSTSRKQSKAA